MEDYRFILDNREHKVVDFLRKVLTDADVFRLVSAYFTIFGYEVLQEQLHGIEDVRFLYGDPGSVGELDPSEQTIKSIVITEKGILPTEELQQKFLAKQCAEWIKKDSVQIRSIEESNFLHGKLYLAESSNSGSAIIGSSNFTKRGLGCGQGSNIEINVATDHKKILSQFKAWFDSIWADENLTKNVKQEVLDELNRIGKDVAPEFVYFKTLYEIYKEELDAIRDNEEKFEGVKFYDTKIWNSLYEFQKDGVKKIISLLYRNNGCILADSVGLGKTRTALGVIKFFELKNDRVLVLCPRRLRNNWELYPAYNSHTNNPFIDDRFGYTLLSHTDLSRDKGTAGSIELKNFNWSNFDLVVIDESHNFRNDINARRGEDGKLIKHSRYSRLLDEIIKQGAKTKVLMLSATPVNTSLIDLRNQIHLITEKQTDTFKQNLGILNIDTFMSQAQKSFKAWEEECERTGKRIKQDLLETLGIEFISLLSEVTIARSRQQIEKFYTVDLEQIGKFPVKSKPDNYSPHTDLECELSYNKLTEEIEQFSLSLYTPSKYVTDEEAKRRLIDQWGFQQKDREKFLIGMMRTNFLKRLESSAHSLTKTLNRTISKISEFIEKIDQYRQQDADKFIETGIEDNEDEETDDEYKISRESYYLRFGELDLPAWKSDLEADKESLEAVLDQVKRITPQRDGKLEQLKKDIEKKASSSQKNLDGHPCRKLIVFTTFKDTAEYLFKNLRELTDQLEVKMAMVCGDTTHTDVGENKYNSILDNFSPVSRGLQRTRSSDEIDLLIATDCISEGQNLQDCDTVLNYDIHWNPIRIIQRFGRIDRIGSRNSSVQLINYWPTHDMEIYLKLGNRVHSRMELANITGSGDDNFLKKQPDLPGIQRELNFRDDQLKKLKEEVFDLDELSNNVVMSDFTLDYFFSQLRHFLEKNREELEKMPKGVYAVTDGHDSKGDRGVIFFLRQVNSGKLNPRQVASPIHPIYSVYISYDGEIQLGCTETKQILELFESLAIGKSRPLRPLCSQFDKDTDNGKKMEVYEELLRQVINHISVRFEKAQTRGLSVGETDFKLPPKSEFPNDINNFELVTWLVLPRPTN